MGVLLPFLKKKCFEVLEPGRLKNKHSTHTGPRRAGLSPGDAGLVTSGARPWAMRGWSNAQARLHSARRATRRKGRPTRKPARRCSQPSLAPKSQRKLSAHFGNAISADISHCQPVALGLTLREDAAKGVHNRRPPVQLCAVLVVVCNVWRDHVALSCRTCGARRCRAQVSGGQGRLPFCCVSVLSSPLPPPASALNKHSSSSSS